MKNVLKLSFVAILFAFSFVACKQAQEAKEDMEDVVDSTTAVIDSTVAAVDTTATAEVK